MRRRPMLPNARRDTALDPAPTRTWRGRRPALPQGIVSAGANPASIEIDPVPKVDHVVLSSAAGLTIADGGGPTVWDTEGQPPTERRGFDTLATELSETGQVTAIPIDLSGELEIVLDGIWTSYRASGSITITRTRNGSDSSRIFDLGPIASRMFGGVTLGWDVRAGDTITVSLPNDSGAGQELEAATVQLRVIEVRNPTAPPPPTTIAMQDWNYTPCPGEQTIPWDDLTFSGYAPGADADGVVEGAGSGYDARYIEVYDHTDGTSWWLVFHLSYSDWFDVAAQTNTLTDQKHDGGGSLGSKIVVAQRPRPKGVDGASHMGHSTASASCVWGNVSAGEGNQITVSGDEDIPCTGGDPHPTGGGAGSQLEAGVRLTIGFETNVSLEDWTSYQGASECGYYQWGPPSDADDRDEPYSIYEDATGDTNWDRLFDTEFENPAEVLRYNAQWKTYASPVTGVPENPTWESFTSKLWKVTKAVVEALPDFLTSAPAGELIVSEAIAGTADTEAEGASGTWEIAPDDLDEEGYLYVVPSNNFLEGDVPGFGGEGRYGNVTRFEVDVSEAEIAASRWRYKEIVCP